MFKTEASNPAPKEAHMLRFLIFFALLLAPAASAGVSTSTDILPEPTRECQESGDSYWNSTGWHENESYYYRYRGYEASTSACSSSSDTARANATSNGQEAASVRYGYGDESEEDRNNGESGEAWGYTSGNESSRSYSWNDGHSTHRSASREGQEASISTFAGQVGTFDGCSSAHQGGYSRFSTSSSSGNGSDYHFRSNSWGWSEAAWGCERTATTETGVTTLRAGEESPCRAVSWGSSNKEYRSSDGSSMMSNASSNDYRSQCAYEYFVEAGSERASVGTRSECQGTRHESYDSTAGEGHSYESQRCENRMGAFGPDGLAVYVGEVQGRDYSCAEGYVCPEDSYSYRHLGAEHALVGEYSFGLP